MPSDSRLQAFAALVKAVNVDVASSPPSASLARVVLTSTKLLVALLERRPALVNANSFALVDSSPSTAPLTSPPSIVDALRGGSLHFLFCASFHRSYALHLLQKAVLSSLGTSSSVFCYR